MKLKVFQDPAFLVNTLSDNELDHVDSCQLMIEPITRKKATSQEYLTQHGSSQPASSSDDLQLDSPQNLNQIQMRGLLVTTATRPLNNKNNLMSRTSSPSLRKSSRRNQAQVGDTALQHGSEFQDPNFNWELWRTPPEIMFPAPGTGTIQCIEGDLQT